MMKKVMRIFGFIVSVLFIGIGIYRQEVGVVLKKAINICLECIGVG